MAATSISGLDVGMREQRLDFRCEDERDARRGRRYSGFLPARSRASVNCSVRVFQIAERKHAVEVVDGAIALLLEQVHDHFRVAARCGTGGPARRALAELPVVVDLAVEDQLDRAVFVADRLVGGLAQIDDAQAAEAQPGGQARRRDRSRRDRDRGARCVAVIRASAPSSTGPPSNLSSPQMPHISGSVHRSTPFHQ